MAVVAVLAGFASAGAGAAGSGIVLEEPTTTLAAGFSAAQDATVRADSPTSNFGSTYSLDARPEPFRRGYVLFDVRGLAGPVQTATLSLNVTKGAGAQAEVRAVADTGWSETGITWANAPALGRVVASQTLSRGRVSFDVTSAVSGAGRVAFALTTANARISVDSRESGRVNAPQLLVTTAEPPSPPASTSPPAVSGTAQKGQPLSTTSGAWSGTTPMTFAYAWLRCDSAGAACAAIADATAVSYTLGSSDVGRTLRSRVTAANASGSATATSQASAVVQDVAPPPPPAPMPTPPPAGGGSSSRLGISGTTWTLMSESSADFDRDMGLIDSSGAGWLRIDFSWANIQRNGPTSYDWAPFDRLVTAARSRGLEVLGVIGYTPAWARPSSTADASTPPANPADFGKFAGEVAAHYGPMGVHAYEIWNEPNLAGNWKPAADPAQYTQLLRAAYTAIKGADSSATVVSGGLSPATDNGRDRDPRSFLQGMYASGAKGHFDAVGHHPYCFPAAPGDAQSWSAWYQMYGTQNSLRSQMEANGDGGKKIWATEFGAPTNGPSGSYVSETTQAQQVSRAAELFRSYAWAGPLFVWSSRDNGTDTGTNYNFFGLLRHDFSAKPSLSAFQAAAAAG